MLKFRLQITLLLCVFQGCGDPGFMMRPVDWNEISRNIWTKQFTDFAIQTRGIRTLIGDSTVDPNLEVLRNTKSIVVESAELITPTKRFPANVYSREPIPPSDSGYHFPVEWKFPNSESFSDVLGDHCLIILKLAIAGEPREIRIEYQKK